MLCSINPEANKIAGKASLRIASREKLAHNSKQAAARANMTIRLYPDIVRENKLAPDHGGSEVDELCEQIRDATKGWGVSG
jgi:hypothetical protein